jgi:hypothetical protein
MASIITFLSGVTCLCIWMFAKNYGLLIFFALANVSKNSLHLRASHTYLHLGNFERNLLLSIGTAPLGGCRAQGLLRLACDNMDHHSSSNTGRCAHCVCVEYVLCRSSSPNGCGRLPDQHCACRGCECPGCNLPLCGQEVSTKGQGLTDLTTMCMSTLDDDDNKTRMCYRHKWSN